MENKIVLQNLLHRPIRTTISALAVAIEVGMVMLVVGMTTGLVNETARRVRGIGADLMVQPPGSSFLIGMTNAPMPIKIGDRLKELPHVLAVSPVLLQFNLGGGVNMVYGIDMESYDQVTGGFVYHSGGAFQGPYDILVDDAQARSKRLKVGDRVRVLNNEFRVAGIVEHGKGSRLFIPLQTAEDISSAHDKASIFFIKCTDPAYAGDVEGAIRQILPKYQILSIQEYMSLMTSDNLPALDAFIAALVSVAVAIGFLVIFLSMYTTITERTREIGILKSLGASRTYIIALILRETGVLSLIGILGGYAGTLVAKKIILASFPTLVVELTPQWAVWAALLALAGSTLGAAYPALRAARLDPVDALAYE